MMPYNVTRIPLASRNRAQGELFNIRGTGFMALPGSFWPNGGLFLALDENNAARIPVMPGMYFRHPFSRFYLFHDQAQSYADNLTLVTLDDPCGRIDPHAFMFQGGYEGESIGITIAGNNQIVAPVEGYRTRVLRYRYEITMNATLAAAGPFQMVLQSSGVGVILESDHTFYLPDTSPSGAIGSLDTGWIDLPSGGILLAPTTPALTLGALNCQAPNGPLATGTAVALVHFRREKV